MALKKTREEREAAEAARFEAATAPKKPVQSDPRPSSSPAEPVRLSPAGMALAVLGAAALVIGCFLPQIDARSFTLVASNSLIQNGYWWPILIALGVLASVYRRYSEPKRGWGIAVAGALAIGLAIYAGSGERVTLYSIGPDGEPNTFGPSEQADPGTGVYVVGVGGLLVLVGGMSLAGRGFQPAPVSTVSAPPPPAAPPSLSTAPPPTAALSPEKKVCPDCAESVLAGARVCKHCGFRFDAQIGEPTV